MMVLFYYAISVIPDQIAIFKNRFGVGSDALAKLNRLRAAVYLQGEDNVLMKYGFRLDVLMNSTCTYMCTLLDIPQIITSKLMLSHGLNSNCPRCLCIVSL